MRDLNPRVGFVRGLILPLSDSIKLFRYFTCRCCHSFVQLLYCVLGTNKINGIALLIQGSIKVWPFSFHFDAGLIHAPRLSTGYFSVPLKSIQNFRGIIDDPMIERCRVNLDASFTGHFLSVGIADSILTIPSYRPDDDLIIKMTISERQISNRDKR